MRTMKAIAALAPVVLGAVLSLPGSASAAGKDHAPDRTATAGASAFGTGP
ncbi:hypothetical protein [Streptomyces sp. C36]